MRDDRRGGSHDQTAAPEYVQLRIAIALWRLRLGSAIGVAAVLMLDQAAAIVFCSGIAFGLAVAVASVRMAQRGGAPSRKHRRA